MTWPSYDFGLGNEETSKVRVFKLGAGLGDTDSPRRDSEPIGNICVFSGEKKLASGNC